MRGETLSDEPIAITKTIYIPTILLDQARDLANRERRSVNQTLVLLIEEALAHRQQKEPHRIGWPAAVQPDPIA